MRPAPRVLALLAVLAACGPPERPASWAGAPGSPRVIPVAERPHAFQFFVAPITADSLPDLSFRSATTLYVYDHRGTELWRAAVPSPLYREGEKLPHAGGPTHGVADADGDGRREIVALDDRGALHRFDAQSGRRLATVELPPPGEGSRWAYLQVLDLAGRGDADVVVQSLDTTAPLRIDPDEPYFESYVNRTLLAWDLAAGRERWRVDQDADAANGLYEGYWGPAHGPFRAADVDGDGRDEIVGGNLVDDDGTVRDLGYPRDWLGVRTDGYVDHLDAVMVGDFRPDLPGIEWIVTEEDWADPRSWHTAMLSTRGVVWRTQADLFPDGGAGAVEPQNAAAGDFDTTRPHAEVWLRSRFPRASEDSPGQHPWVLDADGRLIVDYEMEDVLTDGFNPHENGNREGIEIITPIDWWGDGTALLAGKARHVDGNVGIFDAMTGRPLWVTGAADGVRATLVYRADFVPGGGEELLAYDAGRRAVLVWTNRAAPATAGRGRWADPVYRRLRQNWNYYSP